MVLEAPSTGARRRTAWVIFRLKHWPWPGDLVVRRIYRNARVLLSGKVVAGGFSLMYVSLAAHTLGAELFGVLVLVNAYTLSVAAIVTLQGRFALVRYAALSLAEESRQELGNLLSFVLLIEVGFGLLAIALSALLAPVAAAKFGWPAGSLKMIMFYSLACVSMMHSMPAGVLFVFRRFHQLSIQQTVGPFVRLLGALTAYWLEAGLNGFLLAWLAGTVAEATAQWIFGLRELSRQGLLRGLLHWPAGVTRQHAGIWRFLLANKLNVSLEELSNRITPLAVGWVLGPAAAGLFQLALKIGMVLAQPVMIIGQTLYPELTQLMADRQYRSVTRVVLRTGSIATGIGLVVLLVLGIFGHDILRFMGGPGFDAAYPVLILIALARTIHLFGFPMASALIAGGNPGKVLKINLLATVFLFPVLLVLLRLLQTEGAGWHALLFAFVTVGLMAAAFVRQNHPGVSGLVNG